MGSGAAGVTLAVFLQRPRVTSSVGDELCGVAALELALWALAFLLLFPLEDPGADNSTSSHTSPPPPPMEPEQLLLNS